MQCVGWCALESSSYDIVFLLIPLPLLDDSTDPAQLKEGGDTRGGYVCATSITSFPSHIHFHNSLHY